MLIDRQEKAVIRDCFHGLAYQCPFIWIPFLYFLPFICGFPYPKLRYDVCAAVRPSLQGTEGCARSTAVCFIPLHAGASTCRNNRYSAIWASCLVVAPAHSAFCPQLSFPGRRRRGQTVTHSACAVRRASVMSQAERVPFLFARQTVFLPTQAVSPFIRCLLYRPLANSCSICDYCLLSFLVCHRIGFIGCECRLSRLILPF